MKKTLSFIILCLFSILVFGFSKNVVANEEINYLALGDSTIDGRNTYVDSFQNDYLKASTYTKLSKKGARLEDLYVLLDSEFVTDEYFSTLKLDSTKYVDAIKNADLITLSYNNMDYALKQLKMASLKPYTNVWERFFNEEKMLEVTKILDEFRTNLNNSNVPMVDMVILVIESYAYNYVSTVFTYSKVIEKIKEINPQCDILSVEMYNPLDGIILQIGEFSIDVGMYFNELIALVDGMYDGVSMYETDSYIVEVDNVETKYTEMLNASTEQPSYTQILTTIIANDTVFLPSENGKAYIKTQMISTYESICDHVASSDDGDCTTPIPCSLCGKIVVSGKTEHTPVIDTAVGATCKDFGLTEGCHCSVCGKVIVKQEDTPKLDHTYTHECSTECSVCHELRDASHSFGEWNVVKEPSKKEEGKQTRTCSFCGYTEEEILAPTKKGCGKGSVIVFFSLLLTSVASIHVLLKRK